ncbi:LysM peptidoglycan-binding domain-containing protein [Phycicoccus flavus]|uniref:LysM peptidoglycan-binding domain-containing protein n=1 Tax=Phycicoccus flavus TaxID=2502783 RepID=UPI000FEB992C|nr:LysM peptidoglycan-binding domain-containing protein [Phycicoccus flavus]NHA69485.1 LysM peptidoglycan-binding domain-containing protein [Phycicoccus flavus]
MSAIAWEPLEDLATPAPRRPRLALVPDAAPARRVDEGLRLTARGRLVLLVLAVAVLGAALGFRGMGGAGAVTPQHTVTVGAGQTLSEIAAAELPGQSISQGVLSIQLANDLSTAQVSAGQELVIPRG